MVRLSLARLGAAIVMMGLGGCASSNQLTLTSRDGAHDFAQSFDRAFAGRNSVTGDYDVVLVHDATGAASEPGQPIQPAEINPRQIVHLKVFWKPLNGARADQPGGGNAAVHWYIF